ncbi:MAG: hypothetical protein JW806_09135 [Sedimentisphaerales bacterium]|nr:hypothetical protein [Sedimentisphaerales bacterium]
MDTITVGNKSYEPKEIIHQAEKACGWFGAIAAFSLINSVLIFFQAEVTFVIGLGITMIVDGFIAAAREESAGTFATVLTIIGIMINLVLIGVFALFWFLSRRGSKAAYIIGMVLYLLDGLLFLLFGDFIGLAFHGFFLYMLFGGWGFVKLRAQAESLLNTEHHLQQPLPQAEVE